MSNEETTIQYECNEGIARIRFNRPHRLNAVTEALYDDLLAALERSEADSTVRVAVLTGTGRAFCVGADLKEHAQARRSDFQKRAYLIRANEACKRLRQLSKPVIAAVNGYALGAGAEMALACDFLLMKTSAQIGFPEVSIGTFVGGGVTHTLPRLVGLAQARRLIFLGERIDGAQAKQIGLATEALDDEAFDGAVNTFAARLAAKAPVSMALAKAQLNNAADTGFEAALGLELEGIRACMATRDWQEGIDAFTQKRTPHFRGE